MGSPTPLTYLPQPCIPPTPLYRYDATSPDGQTELPVHRDNGLLSFSLTLGLSLTLSLTLTLTLTLSLTSTLTLTLTLTRCAAHTSGAWASGCSVASAPSPTKVTPALTLTS